MSKTRKKHHLERKHHSERDIKESINSKNSFEHRDTVYFDKEKKKAAAERKAAEIASTELHPDNPIIKHAPTSRGK